MSWRRAGSTPSFALCSLTVLLSTAVVGSAAAAARSAKPQEAAAARTAPSLRFVVEKHHLRISDGKRSADVGLSATKVLGTSPGKDGASLTVRYSWELGCDAEEQQATFQVAQLHAFLENAAALRAHTKKDYARAELGFAKAVGLSPTFKKAVFNLACARTRQNKRAEALATLAGLLRDQPAETYAHIAGDPDLQPLLETPELAACKSRVAGDARIELSKNALACPAVLISKDKALLATLVVAQSWGSANYTTSLTVFDIVRREELFTRLLVDWDDTSPDEGGGITGAGRRAVAPRLEAVNRFLTDFGFAAMPAPVRGVAGDNSRTMRFPGSALGLVIGGGGSEARVLRKNDVLTTIEIHGRASWLTQGYYLVDEKLMVFTWHVDEPEGCRYGGELAGAELLFLGGAR